MATPIRGLVENAWVAYLGGQSTGTSNIYPGISASDKTGPCIICRAAGATEDPMDSGNFNVDCEIIIKGLAADGVAAFDTLCDKVREAIYTPSIHAGLTAAISGFVCMGSATEGKIAWDTQDDCFVETHSFTLYCAAS